MEIMTHFTLNFKPHCLYSRWQNLIRNNYVEKDYKINWIAIIILSSCVLIAIRTILGQTISRSCFIKISYTSLCLRGKNASDSVRS